MKKFSKIIDKIVEASSIRYNNIVYELLKRKKDIIVLSLGEAIFKLPIFSFKKLPQEKIHHYSHSKGIIELREKISKYFLKKYHVKFDPEKEIIITAGSKAVIQMIFMSILNPKDEVIIFEPYWVSFSEQIKLNNAKPVRIPHYSSIFEIEKYITKRTKCIVINNPHNPTGKVYSKKEIKFLLKVASKRKIYIISDEVYSDFVPENKSFTSLGSFNQKKNVILVNSLSKNYGISGWRLGYCIANKQMINQIIKLNQHIITCAPTILQYYAAEYFDEILKITKPQIKQVLKTRNKTCLYLDSLGIKYLKGEATWYIFLSINASRLNSEDFCAILLKKYYVSCVPGRGYGKSCDKFIRIAVGTEPWKRIASGADNIKKLIDDTSK